MKKLFIILLLFAGLQAGEVYDLENVVVSNISNNGVVKPIYPAHIDVYYDPVFESDSITVSSYNYIDTTGVQVIERDTFVCTLFVRVADKEEVKNVWWVDYILSAFVCVVMFVAAILIFC